MIWLLPSLFPIVVLLAAILLELRRYSRRDQTVNVFVAGHRATVSTAAEKVVAPRRP